MREHRGHPLRLFDSPRRRWYLLAVLWVGLLVLGVGGFVQQSVDGERGRSVFDNLYLTLQLATLDYDGGGDDLNWRLQVARFVAPVMAASTVLQTASVVFREQFERWRLRFSRGHVVVCALSDAGVRLARGLADAGHHVIGVDRDPSSAGLADLRSQGIATLVGDPTDPAVLRAARVDRAARLVSIAEDDAFNVSVTTAVREVARDDAGTALRCSIHLNDAELTDLLRPTGIGGKGDVRVEFFNLHERGARALLSEHGPFASWEPGQPPPPIVVMGLGQLGRSVVVAAAQQWAGLGSDRISVTLVDRLATGRWQALRLQHPGLPGVVDVRPVDLDLDAPSAGSVEHLLSVLAEQRPALVAVTFDDESTALSAGIFVHRVLRSPQCRVVVRTAADSGLGGVVDPVGSDGDGPFPGLSLFPFLDRTCSAALVEGGVREQLARGIHEDHAVRSGGAFELHRSWDQLTDEQRESSRRAADGIIDQFGALGMELVPLHHWGEGTDPLEQAQVDRLAAAEHERWRAERTADGWTHGEVRDDAARRNPLLVPWDELAAADREHNRQAIRAVPAMLARAGFELAPVADRG